MKNILLLCVLCALMGKCFAQKQTFDLINFTAPKGWKKDITENTISYTKASNNTWCRIIIVKSTISKGSIDEDFENEWQELVVKNYNPTETAQLDEVQEENGWKIKAGGSKFVFNNSQAKVLLTTATGYNRCASIVATTNSQNFLKDIEALLASVDLIKPETKEEPTTVATDDENSIIGTWSKSGSVNPAYNDAYATSIAGYTTDQYTFNSNGTYHFVSKTFGMSFAKLLLVKENGSYQINGNNIIIAPEKSVLEAWSKKDGGDKWGTLLSSQKRTLEKVSYQFTKHYFEGIQIWNLVLQNNTVTQRDGPHSNNKTFDNAWYYSPIWANNPVIELPDGQKITTEETEKQPEHNTTTNTNAAIVGTWGIATVTPYRSGTEMFAGSINKQYTFNANGTYSFYIKTFQYTHDKLLLTRETGTYQISGNNLTVNPQNSIVEAWSKKDDTDNWGKLLSSQKKNLEKTTYLFTKHYAEVLKEWRIVLQANNETQRDGYYNGGTAFKNARIYSTPCSECLIKLPEGNQIAAAEIKNAPTQQTATTNNSTLVGTWDINASEKTGNSANNYMISGYVNRQYTFNANGTYHFYSKTYQMAADKMFLNKENGTYQINGDMVTIHPQKSEIEAWSRQGNNDVWGKKLNTQNVGLEKATYRFKKELITEINEWQLILKAGNQTKRDGTFNNYERDAWIYIIASPARPEIKLPN